MKIDIGEAKKPPRTGQPGGRVTLTFPPGDHGGVGGRYHIPTRGKTPEQVLAERDRLVRHHEEKARRFLGFSTLRRAVTMGVNTFDIVDITIGEIGTNVELYVVLKSSRGDRVEVRKPFPDIHALPSNAQIRSLLESEVQSYAIARFEQQQQAAALRAALEIVEG